MGESERRRRKRVYAPGKSRLMSRRAGTSSDELGLRNFSRGSTMRSRCLFRFCSPSIAWTRTARTASPCRCLLASSSELKSLQFQWTKWIWMDVSQMNRNVSDLASVQTHLSGVTSAVDLMLRPVIRVTTPMTVELEQSIFAIAECWTANH